MPDLPQAEKRSTKRMAKKHKEKRKCFIGKICVKVGHYVLPLGMHWTSVLNGFGKRLLANSQEKQAKKRDISYAFCLVALLFAEAIVPCAIQQHCRR